MYVHVYLGPPRATFATLSVASVCVADFAKPLSPAALGVAFTVGHDRVPAHGSAAIAPAATPASATAAGGGWPAASLALREVRPLPGSQSRCEMQMNKSEAAAFTNCA